MKRYTVEDVMAWGTCPVYSEKVVRGLFGHRKSVTLVDILSDDRLSDVDAIWCASKAMNNRQSRHFACDYAESVLHMTSDPRCAEIVLVARRYADGQATDEELRAAATVAIAAAYAAAAACAYAVADACAYAATVTAAYAAAAAIHSDQRQALLLLALAGEIG